MSSMSPCQNRTAADLISIFFSNILLARYYILLVEALLFDKEILILATHGFGSSSGYFVRANNPGFISF